MQKSNKKGYVYQHTSPSGKSYIGVSTRKMGVRWEEHVAAAFDPSNASHNYPFQCAIRKYGAENIKSKILAKNVPEHKLYDLEVALIAKHDTFHNGYNQTIGGKESKYTNIPVVSVVIEDSNGHSHLAWKVQGPNGDRIVAEKPESLEKKVKKDKKDLTHKCKEPKKAKKLRGFR